jgi:DNA-binding SARP family transcriptional activator
MAGRRIRSRQARTAGADEPRIVLQGRFAVLAGDSPVRLPHSSERVVAYLAVRSRAVSRGTIAEALWCTSTTEHAGAALRTALWRLGPELGRRLVACDGHALALRDDVAVDLQATVQCARRIASGAEVEDPAGALALLCDAEDVLLDWYDDWVVLERECQRQLRLDALERLCRDFSTAGRYAEAVQAGLAAVASEPLREGAHAALIEAHVAQGNYADAERQYRLLRDMLRRHLGLAPSRHVLDMLASVRR